MSVVPWIPIATKRGITISSAAKSLTDSPISFAAADVAAADAIHIACFNNPINYQYDGNAAIVGVGNGYQVGASLEVTLESPEIVNKLSLIRQGSSDAVVVLTLLRL